MRVSEKSFFNKKMLEICLTTKIFFAFLDFLDILMDKVCKIISRIPILLRFILKSAQNLLEF